jgi:hypothetical protein
MQQIKKCPIGSISRNIFVHYYHILRHKCMYKSTIKILHLNLKVQVPSRHASNSEIHDLNTRCKHNLHFPATNLSLVQKGVLYSETKIFNHLPAHIKSFPKDIKQFKYKLKNLLLEQSLYSLEEFYQINFE